MVYVKNTLFKYIGIIFFLIGICFPDEDHIDCEQTYSIEEVFFNDPRIAILSYSVTPWIDTPDKLADYVEFNDIKTNNWHFLTGNKSEIYSLARESYFAEETIGFSKDSTDFLHTEYFVLVDKTKRIRGIYNGTLMLEAQQVVKDINALLEE